MEVKRRTDYAIRMMVRLAMQDEGPMSVTKLAEADDVPYQFARAIQRDLSEAGLIKMKRGVHGGAVLSRPANEISFYDIFLATKESHTPLSVHVTRAGVTASQIAVYTQLGLSLRKSRKSFSSQKN